jgi:hypothetical protein
VGDAFDDETSRYQIRGTKLGAHQADSFCGNQQGSIVTTASKLSQSQFCTPKHKIEAETARGFFAAFAEKHDLLRQTLR